MDLFFLFAVVLCSFFHGIANTSFLLEQRLLNQHFTVCKDRDSAVGIATRYRLDGPGIEFRWGRDFPHPSRLALGPAQPSMQWVPGLCRGVKPPGRAMALTTLPHLAPRLMRE